MNFIEMEQTIFYQQLEIEDLHGQVAAQAAVIEKLREAVQEYLDANDPSEFGCTCDLDTGYLCGPCHAAKQQYPLQKVLSIPTDSTQILDEVRRAGRERVYQVADNAYATEHVLLAIRAME